MASLLPFLSRLRHAVLDEKRIQIILGSASPRRRELLSSVLGSETMFRVLTSGFEETLSKASFKDKPYDYALATAEGKAKEIYEQLNKKSWTTNEEYVLVVSADTVVATKEEILEKPSNPAHALRMLDSLSGKIHQVHTGVVILVLKKDSKTSSLSLTETVKFHTTTNVKFASHTKETLIAYVETEEFVDKAGGYGIQGTGRLLVESIEGDYFNVVGFPCFDFANQFEKILARVL